MDRTGTMETAPLGPVVDSSPALLPQRIRLEGNYVCLVPLSASEHGDDLWAGVGGRGNDELWRYLFAGPFFDRNDFDGYLALKAASEDQAFYTIVDQPSGRSQGVASLMRIEPIHRVIEVGNILYSRSLQRTRGATEAMYLLAKYSFETLGYRRYEWKCNDLNAASRKAALRLGFSFEGVFRQHMIIKGRNRDTSWFSLLDSEWPERKRAFERWLDPANFDPHGRQKTPLRF